MEIVRVNLASRGYDVQIGSGLMRQLGNFLREACPKAGRTVAVIADSTVADLYGPAALAALQAGGFEARLLVFPAGESNKNLDTYAQLMDQLLAIQPPIDRSTAVVALGGGVTGDLAGFVAATALRGLEWVQCPTTLLADVDASVGGKTAVDHHAGKNLIGAFHQPRGVLIDVDSLKTLPVSQLRNGLAECVKHALIRDRSLMDFIDRNAQAILAADGPTMTTLVARNVAIKAAVVSADEREAGERAHLNFGHTIGHAIESLVGFDSIGHGEAVSLGMVAVCRLAVGRKLLAQNEYETILALLKRIGLPTYQTGLNPDEVWRLMQHDKKALAGRLRMILPHGLGSVGIYSDLSQSEVLPAIAALETNES